ncbi:hypothetical protein EDD22DRAFT_855975 [Suillus occidentalis]|nr:hypothetical protein EDD22DRAFT_855975 [Suillus occidentalis]
MTLLLPLPLFLPLPLPLHHNLPYHHLLPFPHHLSLPLPCHNFTLCIISQPISAEPYIPVPQTNYQNIEAQNSNWLEQSQKDKQTLKMDLGITLSQKSSNKA